MVPFRVHFEFLTMDNNKVFCNVRLLASRLNPTYSIRSVYQNTLDTSCFHYTFMILVCLFYLCLESLCNISNGARLSLTCLKGRLRSEFSESYMKMTRKLELYVIYYDPPVALFLKIYGK